MAQGAVGSAVAVSNDTTPLNFSQNNYTAVNPFYFVFQRNNTKPDKANNNLTQLASTIKICEEIIKLL